MRKLAAEPVANKVEITFPIRVMESIFSECDRYDSHETGGRLVGTYERGNDGGLCINVSGVIEAGPQASRTATSFFQDGQYQEQVFRELERDNPEIEHLGNWHTHHMNGYPTLSGGDRATYHRIVNHHNHNTDFFYALLITTRNPHAEGLKRYHIRHFILYRNDREEYEIPGEHVILKESPTTRPPGRFAERLHATNANKSPLPDKTVRVLDSQFFNEFQPTIRPYLSGKNGRMYWRGHLSLVNDASLEIVIAENVENSDTRYEATVRDESGECPDSVREFSGKQFASAREALVLLERALNREVYQKKETYGRGHSGKQRKGWF